MKVTDNVWLYLTQFHLLLFGKVICKVGEVISISFKSQRTLSQELSHSKKIVCLKFGKSIKLNDLF